MGPNVPRVRRDWRASNEKTWPYPPRVVPALRAPANQRSARGIGVHSVRGGADPGEIDFRPRVVGIAEIWKDV